MGMVGYKFNPNDTEAKTLDGVTTGTGKPIPMQDCRQTVWTIEGTGAISAGTIIIETADTFNYSGTWYPLETVNGTAVANQAYFNTIVGGASGFIRARIGTTIAGGTVTVKINGLLA